MINIKRMASTIAKWCCYEIEQSDNYQEVVQYGLEIVMENILRTILLLAFGGLLNKMFEVALIMFCFSVVRLHAGGMHAKTSQGCTSFMLVVISLSLFANSLEIISWKVTLIVQVVNNILIYQFAPNGSEALDFLDSQYKNKKRMYALIIINILYFLALFSNYRNLIIFAIALEVLSLFLYEVKNLEKEVK